MATMDINADGGTYSTALAVDGKSPPPVNSEEEDDDMARKELGEIHEHADPSRGDKTVDGGDRVKT